MINDSCLSVQLWPLLPGLIQWKIWGLLSNLGWLTPLYATWWSLLPRGYILMLNLIQSADSHNMILHRTPGLKSSSCLPSGWDYTGYCDTCDIYVLRCHKYFRVIKEKHTIVFQHILYSIIFCLSDERFSYMLYSSNFLKTNLEKSVGTSFVLIGDLGT